MRIVLLIVLLLSIGLNAQEGTLLDEKDGGTSLDIKVDRCKVKIKNGRTSIAFIELKPEKTWKQTPYKNSNSYIRNIKAKVSNKEVLNISFGYPISFKHKGIRFNFEDFSPSAQKLEYILTDNYNKSIKESCDIFKENIVSKKHLDFEATNVLAKGVDEKVWRATTIDEVIELLYGVDKTNQMKKSEVGKDIQLTCSNKSLNAMPKSLWYEEQCLKSVNYKTGIKILSSKDLESVALLYTGNKFPLIFFAKFSNYSRLPLRVLTRFYKEGTLMLLAKGKNGKLYYSKSYFLNTRTANDLEDGTQLDFYIK